MPSYFPENNTPLPEDSSHRSLQKINDLLQAGITIGQVEIVPGSDPLPVEGTISVELGTIASVSTFTASAAGVNTIASSDANRKLLSIFNEGPAILYVRLGVAATSSTDYSVRVLTGELYENDTYTGDVTGIFSASGSTARVTTVT